MHVFVGSPQDVLTKWNSFGIMTKHRLYMVYVFNVGYKIALDIVTFVEQK